MRLLFWNCYLKNTGANLNEDFVVILLAFAFHSSHVFVKQHTSCKNHYYVFTSILKFVTPLAYFDGCVMFSHSHYDSYFVECEMSLHEVEKKITH